MSLGKRCRVPRSAVMARSTSLTEKDASLVQYRRSQAVIMSMPPPMHAPWMAAITGLRHSSNAVNEDWSSFTSLLSFSLSLPTHEEEKLEDSEEEVSSPGKQMEYTKLLRFVAQECVFSVVQRGLANRTRRKTDPEPSKTRGESPYLVVKVLHSPSSSSGFFFLLLLLLQRFARKWRDRSPRRNERRSPSERWRAHPGCHPALQLQEVDCGTDPHPGRWNVWGDGDWAMQRRCCHPVLPRAIPPIPPAPPSPLLVQQSSKRNV